MINLKPCIYTYYATDKEITYIYMPIVTARACLFKALLTIRCCYNNTINEEQF